MSDAKTHNNGASRSWRNRLAWPWRNAGTLLLCAAVASLGACERAPGPKAGSLSKIKARGELVVLTRSAPTTMYPEQDQRAGPEYDLVRSFADYLGVRVRLEFRETIGEILDEVAEGKADFAAAGLTRTEQREASFLFGPAYRTVQQQLVCHRAGPVPKEPAELSQARLLIPADSSYEDRLEELKELSPTLAWTTTDELATEQILEKVWRREADCTIADSNVFAVNRRYFPELVVAFPISEAQSLAWVLPKGAGDLQKKMAEWFQSPSTGELLDVVNERYYGHIEEIFDYLDTKTFQAQIKQRLPRYMKYFRKAEQEYGVPWTLLAAVAYQESHWNPQATSPTGVQGMMMLTRPTAQHLGVEDRLNPEHSIMGGARYLARLLQRLPEDIAEPDRTWIALAAYNVGIAHVLDARELARRQGRTPNLWQDIKAVLPLLQQKQHYKTLKHGYARGRETVHYVQAIRDYHDLLVQQTLLASTQ